MHLGVVMTGVGAHAAACLGVLRELQRRGIEPYAVCGMQAGAWPAALFAAGLGMPSMEKALHQAARTGSRMIAPMWYEKIAGNIMPCGVRLNHLLSSQAGQRVLSLCPGMALFPCRMSRTGQRVIFSTRTYMQDAGAMLATQASISFAARAAMGFAPFLSPVEYMGSPLMGETDSAFACRQLMLLGAHRVLLIEPVPSARRCMDALELAAGAIRLSVQCRHEPETGILHVPMPDNIGALSFSALEACAHAGEAAAAHSLDVILEQMGMARCRILAFRRRFS
ncbi:MAG: hypothetical protein IKU38_01860 [Clostridia bacterium]|nr:hypothetical protein [Clostridia bacterium]